MSEQPIVMLSRNAADPDVLPLRFVIQRREKRSDE